MPISTFVVNLPTGTRVESAPSSISLPLNLGAGADPVPLTQASSCDLEELGIVLSCLSPVTLEVSEPPTDLDEPQLPPRIADLALAVRPYSQTEIRTLEALRKLGQSEPAKDWFYRTEVARAVEYKNVEFMGHILAKLAQLGLTEASSHRTPRYKVTDLGKVIVAAYEEATVSRA